MKIRGMSKCLEGSYHDLEWMFFRYRTVRADPLEVQLPQAMRLERYLEKGSLLFISSEYTYIHTYIHSFIHSFIHTFIHSYIHTFIHSYIHSYIHTYIHTYIHLHIHTFTYVHTYIQTEHSIL